MMTWNDIASVTDIYEDPEKKEQKHNTIIKDKPAAIGTCVESLDTNGEPLEEDNKMGGNHASRIQKSKIPNPTRMGRESRIYPPKRMRRRDESRIRP